jgi:glycosyltransferase involved in cell wall biosynthesis
VAGPSPKPRPNGRRIAIDARKWQDYGIGTYVRNIVRSLAQLDHENQYYLFCHPEDVPTLRDLSESFFPVVEKSLGYSIRENWSIPARLRSLKVDLFHAPHYVLPLLTPGRAVSTIHDCIHLRFPEYLPHPAAVHYARFMMSSAIRRSRLVFTVSEASKRDILTYFPWADESRIRVVPNAIDPELLEPPDAEELDRVRERYQIAQRFVLYAGNIKPHKNLPRLIEAFARLRALPGHDDVQLMIIGDEIGKFPELRRRVDEFHVRPHVRFFGFVPERTLASLYRLASVFAFPSQYEGFGLPPLEAMACGTPVVTSNISSLPEVVGDAALLTDPADGEAIASALARVLDDPGLAADLSRRGREQAARFHWDEAARRTLEGYRVALGD